MRRKKRKRRRKRRRRGRRRRRNRRRRKRRRRRRKGKRRRRKRRRRRRRRRKRRRMKRRGGGVERMSKQACEFMQPCYSLLLLARRELLMFPSPHTGWDCQQLKNLTHSKVSHNNRTWFPQF